MSSLAPSVQDRFLRLIVVYARLRRHWHLAFHKLERHFFTAAVCAGLGCLAAKIRPALAIASSAWMSLSSLAGFTLSETSLARPRKNVLFPRPQLEHWGVMFHVSPTLYLIALPDLARHGTFLDTLSPDNACTFSIRRRTMASTIDIQEIRDVIKAMIARDAIVRAKKESKGEEKTTKEKETPSPRGVAGLSFGDVFEENGDDLEENDDNLEEDGDDAGAEEADDGQPGRARADAIEVCARTFLREVAAKALIIMEHSRRLTIQTIDVEYALEYFRKRHPAIDKNIDGQEGEGDMEEVEDEDDKDEYIDSQEGDDFTEEEEEEEVEDEYIDGHESEEDMEDWVVDSNAEGNNAEESESEEEDGDVIEFKEFLRWMIINEFKCDPPMESGVAESLKGAMYSFLVEKF